MQQHHVIFPFQTQTVTFGFLWRSWGSGRAWSCGCHGTGSTWTRPLSSSGTSCYQTFPEVGACTAAVAFYFRYIQIVYKSNRIGYNFIFAAKVWGIFPTYFRRLAWLSNEPDSFGAGEAQPTLPLRIRPQPDPVKIQQRVLGSGADIKCKFALFLVKCLKYPVSWSISRSNAFLQVGCVRSSLLVFMELNSK